MTNSDTDMGTMENSPMIVGKGESVKKNFILRKNGDCLPFREIRLEEGASADICVVIMPGVSVEAPISAFLEGEGARLELSAAYICGHDEKVSIRTDVRHIVPGCNSVQTINGIAGGSSHADFYGRIVVNQDAQKTEAYQSNRNIILGHSAKVDTKPQLEIYADDVKCSHGATIGSLNEDEQFYMRSRGIPEDEAKLLQLLSFISPVLDHLEEGKEELSREIASSIKSFL